MKWHHAQRTAKKYVFHRYDFVAFMSRRRRKACRVESGPLESLCGLSCVQCISFVSSCHRISSYFVDGACTARRPSSKELIGSVRGPSCRGFGFSCTPALDDGPRPRGLQGSRPRGLQGSRPRRLQGSRPRGLQGPWPRRLQGPRPRRLQGSRRWRGHGGDDTGIHVMLDREYTF
jgi:hypothetical protein